MNMSVCVFHEDSGREIFWDSLGLDPDEQAQRHKYATRGRSRREEQGNPATSHLGDSFVPADAEREEVFLSDEPEQLSEPSMVTCFHILSCFLWFGGGVYGQRAILALFSGEHKSLVSKGMV